MAEDVVINGTTYPAVESVSLNNSDGKTVMFYPLPELESPGSSNDLVLGKQLVDGEGKVVEGAFTLTAEIEEQDSLIAQIQAALVGKALPDAAPDPREPYQRVEYITAAEAGTFPYIITDFYADNESGVEVIASFPILQDRIPMGSRENGDPTRFYCVYPMSATSIYYGFNTGSSVSCALKTNTIYRLQTNFLNSRLVNVYDADGNRKGGATLSGTLTPAHTVPVSIFGYNYATNGTISSKREFLLYSARCSKGHEVVREYIPVRRKSDGAVGLYEKFSGTFWGNDDPDGSAFAAGPDVEW